MGGAQSVGNVVEDPVHAAAVRLDDGQSSMTSMTSPDSPSPSP